MKKYVGILLLCLMTLLPSAVYVHAGTIMNKAQGFYNRNIDHSVKIHIRCVDICGSGSGTVFRTPLAPGKFFAITNAHVATDDDGKEVQNIWVEFDDKTLVKGEVLKWGEPGSATDIAIIQLEFDDNVDLTSRSLLLSPGSILERDPSVGTHLSFIGAPAGVQSVASEGNVIKKSSYYFRRGKFLESGYWCDCNSIPGSSGSILYTDDNKIAGMIWGGLTNSNLTISVKPSNIIEMLRLLRLY